MSNIKGPILLVAALGTALGGLVACSDDGELGGGGSSSSSSSSSSGTPGASSSGSSGPGASSGTSGTSGTVAKPVEKVSGDITTSRTLTADKDYLLEGLVSVKPGATLTIAKGTTIKGDNASKAILLVEAGAKIIAQGTEDEPIVFTSQAAEGQKNAGDWGGLVILGKAPVNLPSPSVEGILKNGNTTTYGGTDDNDSSGVLSYVRVEYSGIILSQDNEVNGITFAGVGRGTKVDHVQVRHTLDDCFEFFGGTVDAKYLACQANEDDGFDMDNGFQGRLQFLVLQQDPIHAGEDNGFEIDNDAQGSANTPLTSPQIYNATLLGKNKDVDQAQYGILIRKNARGTYKNLVVTGFEAGLDIRDASTKGGVGAQGKEALVISNSLIWGSLGQGVTDGITYPEPVGGTKPNTDNDGNFDELGWFKGEAMSNRWTNPGLVAPFDMNAPKPGPSASLTAGAATPPADGFFDATATYMGAFKDGNDAWATKGRWAVWSDK